MAAIRSSPGDGRRVDQGRNSDNSQDNVPPWLARQRDDALRTVDRYTPQRIQTLIVAVYALGDPWLLKAAIPARLAASSTFVANPAIWDATYRFMGWMAASLVNMQTETCQRR